jgi:SEC-C motif domain protein
MMAAERIFLARAYLEIGRTIVYSKGAMTFFKEIQMGCYCGREGLYENCCGFFHSGADTATTAEQLMRSRYSAYVLALEDYLLATWHEATRPTSLDFSDATKTKWFGLEVKRHLMIDANHAQVEFVARYKVGGLPAVRLHEISDFVFENGRWFYVAGVFP